jgi:hypothetical protein
VEKRLKEELVVAMGLLLVASVLAHVLELVAVQVVDVIVAAQDALDVK